MMNKNNTTLVDRISSLFLKHIHWWPWLAYRISLKELYEQGEQENKRLHERERKLGKPKDPTDYNVWSEESDWLQEIEEEIKSLKTRRILNKIDKIIYCLPKPSEDSELWERANYIRKWLLTEKGISEAHILIRKNRKEMLEYIVVVIGLIGAITGLVAILKN